jgi:scyllo-inosamine-4-phosphate amidinotransferase 1
MISTYNEWDPLKRCVIGSASYANWPIYDPVFRSEAERTLWKDTPLPSGPVPQHIIDEANEDLQELATTLESLGVEVVRPDPLNFQVHDGMYNYCPRDRLLVYGDTVVDTAMMYPCRMMESQCLQDVIDDAGTLIEMPTDQGMVLDAANVLRLNDTMLYLESASGNLSALNFLREHFPHVKIEACSFYSGVHIDSTITPLREGLVVLNASRVNETNCPKVFDGWDKIWVRDEDIVAQGFYEYPYASKWIALNMLVVNPTTVIVDREQTALIRTLEQRGMTVVPRVLRHSRTLGGGFHCVTLDLVRSK